MKNKKMFPEVLVSGSAQYFEGIGGLSLKSILKGDLIDDKSSCTGKKNHLDPVVQQKMREDFVHAISSWPSNITLELHLTALPDLLYRPKGNLWVTIFIRSLAPSKEKAKEDIISRYISLMPILNAFFPEIEFEPIVDGNELKQRIAPFKPTHALAVQRKKRIVTLSAPLKRLSVGFGPVEEKDNKDNNVLTHCFPWVPSFDDGWSLISILMGQLDPIQIIIRLNTAKTSQKALSRLRNNIKVCELFLSRVKEYQITLNKQADLIKQVSLAELAQLGNASFNMGVFILAPGHIDKSLGNLLGRTITGPYSIENEIDLFTGGFTLKDVIVQKVKSGSYFLETEPFTLPEAAAAFKLPSPPLEEISALPVKRSRTSIVNLPFDENDRSDSIRLFLNKDKGISQPIYAGTEDRMRHCFIVGQTGTGKSTLMENMILQDIHAGRGLAVIDPHGEMVDNILGRIPKNRTEDIILFDLLDKEKPLGFNILEWDTIEERDLIIDELYMTVDHLYDMRSTGGPIFESHFRGMLKLLMSAKGKKDFTPTLLDFTRCYIDKDFRQWLLESTEDPQTKDFVKELEEAGGEASLKNVSPYITSKLSRFFNDTTLRRIVGQNKSSLDFDDIMNNRKVLLVKLGKGRFGSSVSSLISNQIVANLKLAAMKRGNMRPEDRKDFFLYVDECHNLPSDNFMELLSEARKYRMGLILATQYTSQLDGSDSIKDNLLSAITGNVGTTLIFRLGLEDAGKIGTLLKPHFNDLDITGLPNWNGYARLQLNNSATPPFSFQTEKDPTPFNKKLAANIKNLSRSKYGTPCSLVDFQILKRRSIWKEEESKEDKK